MSIKRKILIISSSIILFLGFFVWLLVFPLIGKIKELSKNYSENQVQIVKLEKKKSLLEQLQKDYREKEQDIKSFENSLLKEEEIVGFISTLEEIAAESGSLLEIKSAEPHVPQKNDPDQDSFLSLRMLLAGDFNGFLSFLAYLEDSPYPPYRLIEINRIDVNRVAAQSASKSKDLIDIREGDLKTNLEIKVYTKQNQ